MIFLLSCNNRPWYRSCIFMGFFFFLDPTSRLDQKLLQSNNQHIIIKSRTDDRSTVYNVHQKLINGFLIIKTSTLHCSCRLKMTKQTNQRSSSCHSDYLHSRRRCHQWLCFALLARVLSQSLFSTQTLSLISISR